ncbi:MAG: membrane-bound lytic murein transglycosylase MltF [Gammaproteobacteria bacterium]|nr:membrane-bound lytic murein transglycosylase MltF [Gammaproteobacteria bacterium]
MVDLSPKQHKLQFLAGLLFALIIFALFIAIPLYSVEPENIVEKIQERGYLKVITLNTASTYYEDANGPNGFEYQLTKAFAEYLDVDIRIIVVDEYADIYPELQFESGDLAAANLSKQDNYIETNVDFGPEYHEVNQQIVYRKGQQKRPKKIADLENGLLEVIDGTSHIKLLKELQAKHQSLSYRINQNMATEELIGLVDEGLVDYMLADSHEIALQRRFYPELRIAFNVGEPKQLRWAIKKKKDKSLLEAMNNFFKTIKEDGRLAQLIHRHFSHVEKFNYADIQTFKTHVRERLPLYRDLFIREGNNQGLDWRLLAAIGYQESLWDPKAKSPTGVRGLMMLTLDTAKHVKIKNRLDPEQSIMGGAKYFKQVLNKVPERILQPDRTWLALASYNVGFGHLEDARKITIQNSGDADKWIDVKESLPLLGKKKWYQKTKHGYARGWEPVKYVENIRKYYDILVWLDDKDNGQETERFYEPLTEELSLPPSF